jgi:signal transduction histidine kinase
MSTAQDRSLPLATSKDAHGVSLDAVIGVSSESGRRRRERRRIGLHSIGRRAIDGQLAVEARLAQERRRVAAELHDLVMQDVSFALARARTIAADPTLASRHADEAVAAGERALAGARAILESLAGQKRTPALELFETSVRAAARDIPLSLTLPGEPGSEPDQQTSDALVHIGREAVTNAVKHASPKRVDVVLAREDEWRLTVTDDGCGFAGDDVAAGFGLDSLRRSAELLGGSFAISTAPARGTRIEVSLP